MVDPRALVRVTPVVPATALGAGVVLKLENLQRSGSFKLRGAARAIAGLDPEARAAGVVAASAGNHGAGLALAAQAAGVSCRIVVPELAPAVKRAKIAAAGAEVIVSGAIYDEAEAAARQLARTSGARFVSAFDDEQIIAGNGDDLARELAGQVDGLRQVVCPVGGGGLIGGLARTLAPRGVTVIGVEPATNCAMHDSLAAGRALTDYQGGETLAEGCEGAVVPRTYQLVRDHAAGVVLVSETAIGSAVGFAYRELGQIVEASAAVAIAAVREGAVAVKPVTAVIVSGGNIGDDQLAELLG